MREKPTEKNVAKAGSAAAKKRDDRLKAALKANMARRKAQARARAEVISDANTDAPDGAGSDKG